MTIEITDDGDIVQTLSAYAKHIEIGALAALAVEAEHIMADSLRQVPVDTGVLRGSATVGQPVFRGGVASIDMGYGGAAKAYAWVQHERTDYRHSHGKAKFLEDPFMAHASHFLEALGPFMDVDGF
jgi:hypothetical protein